MVLTSLGSMWSRFEETRTTRVWTSHPARTRLSLPSVWSCPAVCSWCRIPPAGSSAPWSQNPQTLPCWGLWSPAEGEEREDQFILGSLMEGFTGLYFRHMFRKARFLWHPSFSTPSRFGATSFWSFNGWQGAKNTRRSEQTKRETCIFKGFHGGKKLLADNILQSYTERAGLQLWWFNLLKSQLIKTWKEEPEEDWCRSHLGTTAQKWWHT